MNRFFMAIAVALLFVSCGKKYDIEYVSERTTEIQKISKPMKADLDSLAAFISHNAEIQEDLAVKLDTVKNDSLDITALVGMVSEGRISFEDKTASYGDFVFVCNAGNFHVSRDDSTNYNVYEFGSDSQQTIFFMNEPYIWLMHRGLEVYKDSLDSEEMKQLAGKLSHEKKFFKEAKYVVTLTDKTIVLPKMMGENSFEEGILLSVVRVYDRKTAKKIGQSVIMASNSEEVGVLNAMGRDSQEVLLKNDLKDNRFREIALFLNLYNSEKE